MKKKDTRFKKGPDLRRHQFTHEERQLGGILGYMAAQAKFKDSLGALSWLFRRVRGDVRRRRREREGGAG